MLTNDKASRVEAVVHEKIHAVLKEQSRSIAKLSARDKLSDTLGLSSLDLAALISELELALDADPFVELIPVTSIRTVGDLVRAYQLALLPDAAVVHAGQELSAAVARADLRNRRRKR